MAQINTGAHRSDHLWRRQCARRGSDNKKSSCPVSSAWSPAASKGGLKRRGSCSWRRS